MHIRQFERKDLLLSFLTILSYLPHTTICFIQQCTLTGVKLSYLATYDSLLYTTLHAHWCEIVVSAKYDNLHATTTNPH